MILPKIYKSTKFKELIKSKDSNNFGNTITHRDKHHISQSDSNYKMSNYEKFNRLTTS